MDHSEAQSNTNGGKLHNVRKMSGHLKEKILHPFESRHHGAANGVQYPTPMLIAVEGNIGSGKSTVLDMIKELNDESLVAHEQLDVWTKLPCERTNSDINMLEYLYKDMRKHIFPFQVLAQTSIAQSLYQCLKVAKTTKIKRIVTERTVASCQKVFGNVAFENGLMTPAEFAVLEYQGSVMRQHQELFAYEHLIYLKCPVDVCYKRKEARNRPEEESAVTKEYLQQLDDMYEQWHSTGFAPLKPTKFSIINSDCSIDALRDSIKQVLRK